MDPFQGLAAFFLGKLKDSLIGLWWKFLFEIAFSACVSFLFVCGGSLVASGNYPVSIGLGMLAAAISMTALFRKETSRLTKGMIVVLPQREAQKELETDLQTIEKPK